jgi:aminomethyltransferase
MTSNSSNNSSAVKRTALYDEHVSAGGKIVDFAGWEMPVQFTGISSEHEAVRTKAGMFDISHMGKFAFRGPDLIETFQSLVPSDLSRLQPGQAQYTVLLNSSGGILDDIIFYSQGTDGTTGEQRGMAIVNAATKSRDKAWIASHLEATGVHFDDLSKDKALIAVQGPEAVTHLQQFVKEKLEEVKYFGHLEGTVLGKPAFLARTGYTGEDGFEVMVAPPVAVELWQALLAAGVTPCGLGARDTLRLEAAMALYGQDIDTNTTPLEAGLSCLVHLDSKGDFIGREVLEAQKASGLSRRLVGLEMQGRGIARHDYPLLSEGKVVGKVTSGTMSPTLSKAIALAYVPVNLAKVGQQLEVEIRGKTYPVVVVKRPFYKRQ